MRCHGPPEGDLVHVRAARRDDYAVRGSSPGSPPWISRWPDRKMWAVVHGATTRSPRGELRHLRAIHRARDILTTMADKDTDASHRELCFFRSFESRVRGLSNAGRALPGWLCPPPAASAGRASG